MERMPQKASNWQPFMTPQERVRKQVCSELVPKLAELIYQADKGSTHAKLSDLRSEEAKAVYVGEALMILSPENWQERIGRVQFADAEHFAYADKDNEDVARQARQDVSRHVVRCDTQPRFNVMRPGWCWVCKERVLTNQVTLVITENLQAEAHGLCCAKDEDRFERIADFAYRVKGKTVDVDARD